ncbi:MAG: tyrosine--tRNA ligase [Candidatus Omnitrophota bacterium]|nr:tyrosine--tRNA ligase [Candidatus Omnitrophota bacterium]
MKNEIQRQLQIIKENAVDLVSEQELTAKLETCLKANKPLKLKIGFDPTVKDIHLGHTVLLRKLKKLQDLGHFVNLIIGDFTAKIGDPSGRTALRPILSDKEIEDNASTYTEQVFKILDSKKTKVIFNSTWYKDMPISKFLSILSSYTVARMLTRDDFSQRIKENRPLTILEMVYPLIQGYDSVMLESDLEFGGNDQKFNLIVGRHLQEIFGQKPQAILTMPLLVGLDGTNKMSKSLGNYIGITEEPKSIFGKLMSISDEVMWEYFRLLTDCKLEEVKKMHPKEAKLLLAQTLVSFYYSQAIGKRERDEFEKVFSQREIPQDITVYKVSKNNIDIIEVLYEIKAASSKNEARRLLTQGGISVIDPGNSSKITTLKTPFVNVPEQGIVLKIGKKKFLKIVQDRSTY